MRKEKWMLKGDYDASFTVVRGHGEGWKFRWAHGGEDYSSHGPIMPVGAEMEARPHDADDGIWPGFAYWDGSGDIAEWATDINTDAEEVAYELNEKAKRFKKEVGYDFSYYPCGVHIHADYPVGMSEGDVAVLNAILWLPYHGLNNKVRWESGYARTNEWRFPNHGVEFRVFHARIGESVEALTVALKTVQWLVWLGARARNWPLYWERYFVSPHQWVAIVKALPEFPREALFDALLSFSMGKNFRMHQPVEFDAEFGISYNDFYPHVTRERIERVLGDLNIPFRITLFGWRGSRGRFITTIGPHTEAWAKEHGFETAPGHYAHTGLPHYIHIGLPRMFRDPDAPDFDPYLLASFLQALREDLALHQRERSLDMRIYSALKKGDKAEFLAIVRDIEPATLTLPDYVKEA